ncbi:MAG: PQQ-binding-like beta-propeller repeat protein [Planctomycetes bacterium]|nr:PQQ-binding-like beta-propeller repeat protein [Planctomycetota bacterium]
MNRRCFASALSHALWIGLICLISAAQAQEWSMWRGSRGDGISQETGIPTEWSREKNVAWKTPVPGRGLSSPIVSGGAIYVTTADPQTDVRSLMKFDPSDGKVLWTCPVHRGPVENQHKFNTSASSTPAGDSGVIYCTFADDKQLIAAAVSQNGEILWKVSLGSYFSKHGFAASPVFCEVGVLINGHQDGEAFVAMLAKDDGREVWRFTPPVAQRSFSTPYLTQVGSDPAIILLGANRTMALKLQNGAVLWQVEGPTEKVVCSPSVGHGMVFAFGGSPDVRAFALPLDPRSARPDVPIWRLEKGMPYVPTPLLYGDYLHVVDDGGVYTCLEPKTGKSLHRVRKGGNTYSSPIGIHGLVYSFEDSGRCVVFRNSDRYEVVASNELGESVQTTPCVMKDSLIVRGENHLWCIRESKKPVNQWTLTNP